VRRPVRIEGAILSDDKSRPNGLPENGFVKGGMEADNALDELVDEMRGHFLVPPTTEQTFAEFDSAVGVLRPEYQAVAKAFRYSMTSTLSTVAIPFALASASVEHEQRQRILISAKIHAKYLTEDVPQPGEDIETFRERTAHTKTDQELGELTQSDFGKLYLKANAAGFLLASIQHGGLGPAAEELLLQGLVLLWSAFEVLCRDAFETVLNNDPAKVQALTGHPITRKRFEAERLPLDTLIQHGFDLSARLGTVLIGQQDFSDLPTVKAVYSVLYPSDNKLNLALAHSELWKLYQRRHLIVHRRGVVDRVYLDATGETHAIGSRLVVAPSDFEKASVVVVSAGAALVRCLPHEANVFVSSAQP
jgi:hypothetical protein